MFLVFILLVVFILFNFLSNVFSNVHQPLSQIRISLSGSLGAAQVLFLGGINFTESTVRNFPRFVESCRVPCHFFKLGYACMQKQTKVVGNVLKI